MFEQEADAMADHVVNNRSGKGATSADGPGIQQKEAPMISRMEGKEDEMATKPEIQQEGEDKEELTTKPEIQTMGDEKEMQEQPEINKAEEEEMEGAAKQEAGARTASAQISNQVIDSQGRGKKLPASTQKEMSAAIGHDFSEVNIHTGEDSVAMNKETENLRLLPIRMMSSLTKGNTIRKVVVGNTCWRMN